MARFLFASHDGFGLGHVRRNTLIARALLAAEPRARLARWGCATSWTSPR